MSSSVLAVTTIAAGFIMLSLIYLLATFLIKKIIGLRLSGASVVASFSLTLPSMIIIIIPFENIHVSGWSVAAYMLCCVTTYCLLLWVFQPDSLLTLGKKELKKSQLKDIELIKKNIRIKLKSAKSAKLTDTVERLNKELAAAYQEEKAINWHYSKRKTLMDILAKRKRLIGGKKKDDK